MRSSRRCHTFHLPLIGTNAQTPSISSSSGSTSTACAWSTSTNCRGSASSKLGLEVLRSSPRCRRRRRTPRSCPRCRGSSPSDSRRDRGTGTRRPCARTTRGDESGAGAAGQAERTSCLLVSLVGMLAGRCPTCSRPRSTRPCARARDGSRRRHIAPHGAAVGGGRGVPDRAVPHGLRGGRARASATPRRSAGRAATSAHVLVGVRRAGARRPLGRHAGRARQPRDRAAADRPVRHARAAARGSSRPCLREGKIAALAITEPGGGSDVAGADHARRARRRSLRRHRRQDLHHVGHARRLRDHRGAHRRPGPRRHLAARDRAGHAGLHGREGSSRRPAGGRATPRSCTSTACRVPVANRIGPENGAFPMIMMNFASERLMLAGQCVAIAELAYRESIAYARERHAFGKPLTGFQVTRHKLADMASRIAAARALTGEVGHARAARRDGRRASRRWRRTSRPTCAASCATRPCSSTAATATCARPSSSGCTRDARLYPIGGGTREIMNEVIAKTEGY